MNARTVARRRRILRERAGKIVQRVLAEAGVTLPPWRYQAAVDLAAQELGDVAAYAARRGRADWIAEGRRRASGGATLQP